MNNLSDRILSKSRTGAIDEFLSLIEPTTEADSLGIIIIFLNMFGSMVGTNVHLEQGDLKHRANFFSLIVGDTANGRKGTTLKVVKDFFNLVDPQFFLDSVRNGLSSGEGVIKFLADSNKKGVFTLLAIQPEASAVFKNFERNGNKLSELIREAFDDDPIANMSVSNEMRVERHYICFIFLITKAELLHAIKAVELLNGFANRFIWALVHRSKILSNPPKADVDKLSRLAIKIREAVNFARAQTVIKLTEEAELMWDSIYQKIHKDKPDTHTSGLKGRFDVLTLRLALNFALLDQSDKVTVKHLEAANELIEISEHCIESIFERKSSVLDSVSNKILNGLSRERDWVTQTSIMNRFFSNNIKSDLLNEKLNTLESQNYIKRKITKSDGKKSITQWCILDRGLGLLNV